VKVFLDDQTSEPRLEFPGVRFQHGSFVDIVLIMYKYSVIASGILELQNNAQANHRLFTFTPLHVHEMSLGHTRVAARN